MTKDEMKEFILDYIKEKQDVTFAELQRRLDDEGDSCIVFGDDSSNLILWVGCSSEFYQSFTELLKEEKIVGHPCNPMCYWIDGRVPSLPVAKRMKKDYKKEHWLPTVWFTKDHAEKNWITNTK